MNRLRQAGLVIGRLSAVLAVTYLLIATSPIDEPRPYQLCIHEAESLTFDVGGTCGEPGTIVVSSGKDACTITVTGASRLRLPSSGRFGQLSAREGSSAVSLRRSTWTLSGYLPDEATAARQQGLALDLPGAAGVTDGLPDAGDGGAAGGDGGASGGDGGASGGDGGASGGDGGASDGGGDGPGEGRPGDDARDAAPPPNVIDAYGDTSRVSTPVAREGRARARLCTVAFVGGVPANLHCTDEGTITPCTANLRLH